MNRIRKIIVSITTITLIAVMTMGCSKSTTETSTEESTESEDTSTTEETGSESQTDSEAPNAEGNGVTGQVTAVNGSEITISANKGGGAPQGEKPDGDSQNAPATEGEETAQDSEAADNESEESTDADTQNEQNQAPQSETGEMPEMETEEQTITIEDESIIYVKDGDTESQGSLEDITVGKMISITYTTDDAGNQVMEKITVQGMSQMPEGGAKGDEAKDSTTEEDAATDSTTETAE